MTVPVATPLPEPDLHALPAVEPAPSTLLLFLAFSRISLLSVGGGLTAWIRRLVVEERRWMDEPRFLSGYALSQIAPGPNAVNLAVFVGATLRGARGAVAGLAGLMLPPFAVVLFLGWLYGSRHIPRPVEHALDGMGAAAIGLVVATGLRMVKGGIRSAAAAGFAILTVLALAAGIRLLLVVAVLFPLALLVLGRRRS
ncbi:chromate transporter [Rhizosaccharibacter radicis]|uniref:Chromate transporter n=1 Tax=Rhizosaccharibacter radicis TaxID=2782605 RepID=A0ABT1VYE1_9PROT|nr:chromate transporter [Acetobacteraceae bacterium KSS12]